MVYVTKEAIFDYQPVVEAKEKLCSIRPDSDHMEERERYSDIYQDILKKFKLKYGEDVYAELKKVYIPQSIVGNTEAFYTRIANSLTRCVIL